MKYLHILDEFSLAGGGGVRSVVADVSQEMARRGVDVSILALDVPEGTDIDNLNEWSNDRSIHFGLLRQNDESLFHAARKLRGLLKDYSKNEKCCLYMHLKRGVLVGILGSLGLKDIRRIEVFHSNYINYQIQARICRYFIDHYLPVSKESRQQLINDYGIKQNKITLAYNGIDLEKVRNLIRPIERDKKVFRVLSVGRMAVQKNLETSIQAYKLFKSENESINCEYIVAGDGPQRKELEALAGGDVNFLGMIEREDVISLIASADVFVLPSLWEGHSIALLEVLAIGCPVIVTDIPAFREVLDNQPLSSNELFRDGPFGAVFHKMNVESCKAAIDYMAKHKENHRAMREYVKSLAAIFTLQEQTSIYLEVANY